MTKEKALELVRNLEQVFAVVRLVDVERTHQYFVDDQGNLVQRPYECYAVWHRHKRCENCISAQAFIKQNQLTKFEFVDHDVYHVTAKYMTIEGTPYVLEMVTKLDDESLFGSYGKLSFEETITSYNKKLNTDSLTGVFNRRYYQEQVEELGKMQAFAIIDVDNFKEVNDQFGHQTGDKALRAVAQTLATSVRGTDIVVRYGGDEFLAIFPEIPREAFGNRLEKIRERIQEIEVESCPELRLTASIGGVYGEGSCSELLGRADERLYQAKKTRNTVCWA